MRSLNSSPADVPISPLNEARSQRARQRAIARQTNARAMPTTFLVLGFLCLAISVPLWFFTNSAAASLTLCACITGVSVWYVTHEAGIYGGLTFSSCFVAISAFVFAARGVYISVFNDFSIITPFEQPAEHRLVTDALVYVLYGTLAFIFGALLLQRKTLQVQKKFPVQRKIALASQLPNVSLLFLGLQVGFACLLLPYGKALERASLTENTTNAYIYALPMLVHGFDLYFIAYMVTAWIRNKNAINLLMLLGSAFLLLVHAYCLYNMSNFRGFYLVGLFTAGIVFILARWRKMPVLLLLLILAFYPLFKNMGSDRTLSNKEMVKQVLLTPSNSYDRDGMERAFGETTDINMLDTFVASLNYEHKFHPYILSDLYVFVHWIPRSLWPGKPPNGILDDLSYTLGRPFTPGIIGFFNDDGGKLYMIVAMGFLGALFKWCQLLALRIKWFELYLCTWAALFLTSLVTVRYLPYQAFYGFLMFFVPALLLNWGVRFATGQPDQSGRTGQRNGKKRNKPVAL
jgi:hypothetical protein